jgi:hypothetical protein
MKTSLRTLKLAAIFATTLATFGTASAKADTITIAFDQPSQTASAGATLEFFGTITNDTNSTIFLNSDDFNLQGLSFTVNDQFFNTVPVSLAAGASSGEIELFDVTLSDPLQDAPGTYSGTYGFFGGASADAQDNLTSQSFSVTSAAATSPVPEPSTVYLLLSGLSVLAPIARKIRTRA